MFALSNITAITALNSSVTTINITGSPFITLLSPLNNSNILANLSTPLSWRFDGNLDNATCKLFINSVLNKTLSNCPKNTDIAQNINFSTGTYSYRVEVNDSVEGIFLNSSERYFTIIENKNVELQKSVQFIDTYIYQIQLLINNTLNNTFSGRIIDFVDTTANSASYSLSPTSTQFINGSEFNGELLYWNISLAPFDTTTISYSLVGVGNYTLKNNFITGVE